MADQGSTTNDRPITLEDQINDYQLNGTHSSPIKDTLPSIDSHKRDQWSAHVYPHVETEIKWEEMLQKLCPTGLTQNSAIKPPKMKKTEQYSGKSDYCDYLNKVSRMKSFRDAAYIIDFRPKENQSPLFHATRTRCRPDIVAVRQYPDIVAVRQYPDIVAVRQYSKSSRMIQQVHWSHLEATGEEDSNKPKKEGEAQAGAHTAYHLQARPDLVSVPGIFVSESYFQLFFSNACRVYHTCAIEWNSLHAQKLLYAWMWRLYHPECDQSITVEMKKYEFPTFTITTTDGKRHDLLVVLRAGESIGRRTIVLGRPNPNSSIVIKEQYIENGRRFKEGLILEKIHKSGRFPGVVRLDHCEYVTNGDKKIPVECKQDNLTHAVTRSKIRLVLKDKGTRLTDVKTPRSLLMGIFDVLETTRILFREPKISHRDISPDNVLFCDESVISTESLRHDLGDMCFSKYLLDGSAEQGDSDAESDRRRRLTTKVIVIDFDSAEDRGPGNHSLGEPKARTGTPVFMARMVRSHNYPAGLYKLPPMPDVAPELLEHYQRTLKARLEGFAANKEEFIEVPQGATLASNDFQHLLRYDAESVFWYLLWWCMQAQPAGKSPDEKMFYQDWYNLTGPHDKRDANFIKTSSDNCLHSSYAKLSTLLEDMRKHLQGDLRFCKDKERKENPEYMHEVFQRFILNFLVANKAEPFMDLEKADEPRRMEEAAMDRKGTTQGTKRSFDVYADMLEDLAASNKKQRNK